MRGLTRRQQEILDWILDVVEEKGYFPSFREIGEAFGLRSPGSVSTHMEALRRKGYLVRERDRIYPSRRCLRKRGGVPIVGQVAAGVPILAVEHIEGRLDLGDLFGGEGLFAVRVEGESMRDAGILHGDYAVVRDQRRVANGEVTLAYVGEDQEATIKVFRQQGDRVDLEPRSPAFETIRIGPEDPHFRIGGKVIGVVRSFRSG